MRESDRYVRGMFSWVGFKQAGVVYDRDERFAGKPSTPQKDDEFRHGRHRQLLERAS